MSVTAHLPTCLKIKAQDTVVFVSRKYSHHTCMSRGDFIVYYNLESMAAQKSDPIQKNEVMVLYPFFVWKTLGLIKGPEMAAI